MENSKLHFKIQYVIFYLFINLFVCCLFTRVFVRYVSELGAIFCCHASEKLIHRHNQCGCVKSWTDCFWDYSSKFHRGG